MPSKAGAKKTADKLINKTFKDFKSGFTVREQIDDYPNPPRNISETHEGIRVGYKKAEVDGELIQKGDFKIITEAAIWSLVDIRADNVSGTFDGKEIRIVAVEVGDSGADLVIQAREK